MEEFFSIIYNVHAVKKLHQGIVKTNDAIQARYYGITRDIIDKFKKLCPICDLNLKQIGQPRLKPITSTEINERLQVDLIDM